MLTSMRIQNFKAWKDTDIVRLAPLTILFGPNSAGKSSMGHLLLALKQTVLSTDRHRALHLGDTNSLIDLGTYDECIHNHNINQSLSFKLEWNLSGRLELKDPLQKGRRYSGDKLSLKIKLNANKMGQPELSELRYRLYEKAEEILDFDYLRKQDSKEFDLNSNHYKFVRTEGRPWPLDEPEKFYRISDKSRAKFQNSDFMVDFALAVEEMIGRFYYIGPLREYPRRIYQWSGDTPEDVGHKGEYAIAAILAAKLHERKLNRGPKTRLQPFDEFVAKWLKDLGIIQAFSVRPVAKGRKEYEVLVKTRSNSSEVKISDVGFGVSQVLPALVEAFYCPSGSVVWMEQPEIHLHPQVQSELADVFIAAIKARENGTDRNVQLIVESHSEHFLNRLQRRVAEKVITPDDIAIYFCAFSGKASKLVPLQVDMFGDIANWPENFFGDEMAELTARTIAAMRRQKEKS